MPIKKLISISNKDKNYKDTLQEIAKDDSDLKKIYYPISSLEEFINFDKQNNGICSGYSFYKKVDMLELYTNIIILTEFKAGIAKPDKCDIALKLIDSILILSSLSAKPLNEISDKVEYRVVINYKSDSESNQLLICKNIKTYLETKYKNIFLDTVKVYGFKDYVKKYIPTATYNKPPLPKPKFKK